MVFLLSVPLQIEHKLFFAEVSLPDLFSYDLLKSVQRVHGEESKTHLLATTEEYTETPQVEVQTHQEVQLVGDHSTLHVSHRRMVEFLPQQVKQMHDERDSVVSWFIRILLTVHLFRQELFDVGIRIEVSRHHDHEVAQHIPVVGDICSPCSLEVLDAQQDVSHR